MFAPLTNVQSLSLTLPMTSTNSFDQNICLFPEVLIPDDFNNATFNAGITHLCKNDPNVGLPLSLLGKTVETSERKLKLCLDLFCIMRPAESDLFSPLYFYDSKRMHKLRDVD